MSRENVEIAQAAMEAFARRDIDDARVLVTGVFTAVGKRGSVPVEQRYAHLVTVRDGKITRTESFLSPEEALQTLRGMGASPGQ